MKRSISFLPLLFSLVILILSCKSEPKSFEDEVRQVFHGTRGFYYVKIPPALLTMVLKVADDKELTDFFGNARQVGIISFGESISEGNRGNNPELVKDLDEMLQKYEYEDLINISDSGKSINMKIREDNGKVTELVAIVAQNQGGVMGITLSGEIDVQTIVKLAAEMDFDKLMQIRDAGRR